MQLTIFNLKKLIFIVLFCCCDATKKPDNSKTDKYTASDIRNIFDAREGSLERLRGDYAAGRITKSQLDQQSRNIEKLNKNTQFLYDLDERVFGPKSYALPQPLREKMSVDFLNSKNPWYKNKKVIFIGVFCSLFVLAIVTEIMQEYFSWQLERAKHRRLAKGLKPLGGVLAMFFT